MDERFEAICQYKEQTSNLNKVFESYGCSTLEAKVPIVDDRIANNVANSNHEHQVQGTLELQSKAGVDAVTGRLTRTKDRPLTLVEIGHHRVIAAGKIREKSPVDRGELDDELEEYMRKTAEIKAQRAAAKQERQQVKKEALVMTDVAMITQNIDPDWD